MFLFARVASVAVAEVQLVVFVAVVLYGAARVF